MMNENINENIVELNDDALEAVTGGRKVITTGNVNVRMGAGLYYATLGSVGKGVSLTYAGESKKDDRGVRWYMVKFRGDYGWVSSRYSKLN